VPILIKDREADDDAEFSIVTKNMEIVRTEPMFG
jgi:hypothetical protein